MTTSDPTTEDGGRLSNLTMRILTALIVLPIVVIAAWLNDWLFALLVGLVVTLGTLEFYIFARGRTAQGSSIIGIPVAIVVVVSFYLDTPALWQAALVIGILATFTLEQLRHPEDIRRSLWQVATTLAGILYVAFPASFLIAIRNWPDGFYWLFTVFAITWGTDTFAYFGGRWFGKTKLAPRLSPKKTREGALVGVIGGVVPAMLILLQAGLLSVLSLGMIVIGPFIAIAGDLFESALKRFFRIKDSHLPGLNIFPGHGGVLDRVDALIWVALFVYVYAGLTGIV